MRVGIGVIGVAVLIVTSGCFRADDLAQPNPSHHSDLPGASNLTYPLRVDNEVWLLDIEVSGAAALLEIVVNNYTPDADASDRWFWFYMASPDHPLAYAGGGVIQSVIGKEAVSIRQGDTSVAAGPPILNILFGIPSPSRHHWEEPLEPGRYVLALAAGGVSADITFSLSAKEGGTVDAQAQPADAGVLDLVVSTAGEWNETTEAWLSLAGAAVLRHRFDLDAPLSMVQVLLAPRASRTTIHMPDGETCGTMSSAPQTTLRPGAVLYGAPSGQYEVETVTTGGFPLGGPYAVLVIADLPSEPDANPAQICF